MASFTDAPIRTLLFNIVTNPKRVASIGGVAMLWQRTYFGAQNSVKLEDATLIETPADDLILANEQAIYPYLFACFYILYVAAHLIGKISQEDFKRSHEAFRRLILDSEKIFVSHPTRMRDRARLFHPLTKFTQSIDGPTNCFPSLHVSLVVLSYQILKEDKNPDPIFLPTMKSTCVDICRSTMQTKQHSIIDVIGGIALSHQIYEELFGLKTESLLEHIFPELGHEKLALIQHYLDQKTDLPTLMQNLLKELSA